MPASYKWFNDEKTIMLEVFEGSWTWQDFSECVRGAIEQIKTVSHDVMVIADYMDSDMMPVSGASLRIARDVMNDAPENWKGVVIVSNNRLIQAMVSLFQNANRTFGSKVYLESTVADAVKRINIVLLQSSDTHN